MSETPRSMIHQLRNHIRNLDENILTLYLVDREFDSFARPILHWFINRPEIIGVLDATDILIASFNKKYGGTSDFWREYISVGSEEMQSAMPATTQTTTPKVTARTAPATTEHKASLPVTDRVGTAATNTASHAEPHAENEPAADKLLTDMSDVSTSDMSTATEAEVRDVTATPQRPTSPLQGTGTTKQRVRAKTPTRAPTGPRTTAPPTNLVGVSVAADQNAELTETPARPSTKTAVKAISGANVTPAAADQRPDLAVSAPPPSKATKAKAPQSEHAAAKHKKAVPSETDESKPVPVFIPEPERERLFDQIRATLNGMMQDYKHTQFKELAEQVNEAAKDHEGISAPVSILYALHSNNILRKHNRTYVTSQTSALNILRLLRHMKNPESGHLQTTDEELMAEFLKTEPMPHAPGVDTSLIASN